MIASPIFWVYVEGYRLDARFVSLYNPLAFPSKVTRMCALKLTYLWITSLLFVLNYKFVNGRFAFSPG